MASNNFVILISGPTATGKSDFTLQLADELQGHVEIINADIGSFYTHLTIGTAKPDWKASTIPHHFFDVINDTTSWTAPQFREQLKILIDAIWARGNIPIIVGGSAFYIQAFFYKNHTLELPTPELIESLEEQPAEYLWKQLYEIDAVRAAKIDPNDHYRLVRALAIWHTQGQKPSDFQQIFDPIAPFYFVTLTRDRDQLYTMINERVTVMMEAGWLAEVKALLDDEAWVEFLFKKKMIGYDLLAQYLLGYHSEKELQEVVDLIAQRTRNYAKRQLTFLKKLQSTIGANMITGQAQRDWSYRVREYNISDCDISMITHQVAQELELLS